jgi:hypothetical protein
LIEELKRELAVRGLLPDMQSPIAKRHDRTYYRRCAFGLYGHAESKKTQKFVFRSALRPNQISFSHSQDPMRS